jgi:predicted nucleotide-binding protein
MAKRTNPVPEPTELIVSRAAFKKDLEERIALGKEIHQFEVKTQADFDKNQEEYYEWSDYNSEFLKQSFNNPYNEYKKSYDDAGMWSGIMVTTLGGGGRQSPAQKLSEFKDKVDSKLKNLTKLLGKSDLLKTSVPDSPKKSIPKLEKVELTENIFIVHGHDDRTKLEVARTLEQLGLKPIILHEQPNEGRTIIEKFELHSNVNFAVVIMTADDLGKVKTGDEEAYRARQNVILEMGYFIGKLGRSKVFPLYEEGVELPSDLYGLLYNPLDGPGTWKFKLVKELKAAGYDVDANQIL